MNAFVIISVVLYLVQAGSDMSHAGDPNYQPKKYSDSTYVICSLFALGMGIWGILELIR